MPGKCRTVALSSAQQFKAQKGDLDGLKELKILYAELQTYLWVTRLFIPLYDFWRALAIQTEPCSERSLSFPQQNLDLSCCRKQQDPTPQQMELPV